MPHLIADGTFFLLFCSTPFIDQPPLVPTVHYNYFGIANLCSGFAIDEEF
jgi:hypothetical protein